MADEDEPRSSVQSDLQISELEAHNRKYSYSSNNMKLWITRYPKNYK
jgi:hypothetical protein